MPTKFELDKRPPVNLNTLGVHGLVSELTAKYNQNNDTGIIRNWFRRNKLQSQEKHLKALFSLVQEAREHASSLVEFKSDLITQQKRMEDLILLKTEESEFAVDRQREEHQTFLSNEETSRIADKARQQREFLENEKLAAENKKTFWEAQQDKHKARIIELKGHLIEKLIDEVDFKNINMKHVFIIIEMLKEAETKADILNAEAQWEHYKVETDIKAEQAKQEKVNTKQKKWKFEQDKKFDEEL